MWKNEVDKMIKNYEKVMRISMQYEKSDKWTDILDKSELGMRDFIFEKKWRVY